ncbi:transglycosylase SLT domain-containing protein [Emcibacter sp. SYSU 3D8]|uniref:transglycosylase SLT domain-containing protein n=1 Tax=Emcibacter sp. SYSU 3D8 TaxID=3133969 RepID=UPI0031FEE76F
MKLQFRIIMAAGVSLLVGNAAAAQNAAAPQTAVTAASAASTTVPAVIEPKVLSPDDAQAYRKIFELQQDGRWAEADKLIRKIKDTALMGHVLYQRYMHPTKYRSTFHELRDWMTLYADHPEANDIYSLAMRRKPKRDVAPVPPVPQRYVPPEIIGEGEPLPPEELERRRKESAIRSQISSALRSRDPEKAERALMAVKGKGIFTSAGFDTQMSLISKAYYFNQKYKKALDLGSDAAERNEGEIAEAAWVAGLSAWRMQKYGRAAKLFEKCARARDSGNSLGSAGAYWSARAHLKDREPEKAFEMLNLAVQNRRTFYGILAARQLGMPLPYDWSAPQLTQADFNEALDNQGVRRAAALAQVGDTARADEEMRLVIRRLAPDSPRASLLRVAFRLDFIGSAVTLARQAERKGGPVIEAALYPLPQWQPQDGFKLDRALLFAFTRQESNFMARVVSSAGARGLMQLMPSTAAYISADPTLKNRNAEKLFDPSFNMMLGQKYLLYLFDKGVTQSNLILVAASYNAGPGNVSKWLDRDDSLGDWLLFMESIPIFETRAYVEHVLENLWVYRARFNQPSPSLDAMVVGEAPLYSRSDPRELAAQ